MRMEKVLARRHPLPETLSFADVTLEESSHIVRKNGEPISVKPMEYELLRTFILNPGMVLTRENLLRIVWGDACIGETRTVDVHVAALRKKLSWEARITTVYKLGYRLEAAE